MLSRTSVALLLCSSLLVACSKEKETLLAQEKLPPAKIEASAKVSKNSISFDKASLGKLFMLVPSGIKGSRSAALNMFLPQLISFEKSGDRIAVFNQTTQNIYDTIKSDQLIQSFAILEETEDKVVFDLGQGFLSMNNKTSMDILVPQRFATDSFMDTNKMETHVEVKDSFVSSASLRNNSIFIKQIVRLVEKYKNPYGNMKPEEAAKLEQFGMGLPDKVETSNTLYLEIKPYVPSTDFKSKAPDALTRFGYFINKAFLTGEDDARFQVAKWNFSDNSGPIRVLIDNNTPQKFVKAVSEGVRYWNMVFGKEVLQIEAGYSDTEPQKDRTVVVRWVQWDEGFGAFANAQVDPLTGEAFRGYIYISTTFTRKQKEDVAGYPGMGAFSIKKNSLCGLDYQNKDLDDEDTIRTVIAHEMGHVLGLRHNFAGSSSAPASDQKISEALKQFKAGDRSNPVPLVSTVMDYTSPEATAVVGSYIKTNKLPYDNDAIAWAYKDVESEAKKNSFCSDEHIMEAQSGGRSVLGCERMDLYSNVFFAARERFLGNLEKALKTTLDSIRYTKQTGYKYAYKEAVFFQVSLDLPIAEKLYKTEKKNSVLGIDFVVKNYISPYLKWGFFGNDWDSSENAEADQILSENLKALGGLDGFINSLIPQKNGSPEFFQDQVKQFLAKEGLAELGLDENEIKVVTEGLLIKAKEQDESLAAQVENLIDKKRIRSSISL